MKFLECGISKEYSKKIGKYSKLRAFLEEKDKPLGANVWDVLLSEFKVCRILILANLLLSLLKANVIDGGRSNFSYILSLNQISLSFSLTAYISGSVACTAFGLGHKVCLILYGMSKNAPPSLPGGPLGKDFYPVAR